MKRAGRSFFKKMVHGTSQVWICPVSRSAEASGGERKGNGVADNIGYEENGDCCLELVAFQAQVFFQSVESTVANVGPFHPSISCGHCCEGSLTCR